MLAARSSFFIFSCPSLVGVGRKGLMGSIVSSIEVDIPAPIFGRLVLYEKMSYNCRALSLYFIWEISAAKRETLHAVVFGDNHDSG
jgi:hypothetical protein